MSLSPDEIIFLEAVESLRDEDRALMVEAVSSDEGFERVAALVDRLSEAGMWTMFVALCRMNSYRRKELVPQLTYDLAQYTN